MPVALLNVTHWTFGCVNFLKTSHCHYLYFKHKVGGGLNLEVLRQLTCTFTSLTKLLCIVH